MSEEQHSSTKINRQHVIETSVDFLTKQVSNQRLHVANLLAKTGDTESYSYLQTFFKNLEEDIIEAGEEAIYEVRMMYSKGK